jgi:hypothetical protein
MKISESTNYQTTSIAKSTAKVCINGLIISKAGIEDVSTYHHASLKKWDHTLKR